MFGSFKESFQCLKRLRVKSPLFACEIIKACAMLHNLRPETEAPTENNSDDDGAVNVAFDVEGRAAALA